MVDGPSVEWHHWIPRSRGGRDSAPVHRVCHRMIHRRFDSATLARTMNTPDALRTDPAMARFLAWVRKQPPEFVARTEDPAPRPQSGHRRRTRTRR